MTKTEIKAWQGPDDLAESVDRFLQAPEVTYPCMVLAFCSYALLLAFVGAATALVCLWLTCSIILTSLVAINVVMEVSRMMGPIVTLVPFSAVFVWRISNYARKGRVAPAAVYTVLFLMAVLVVARRSLVVVPMHGPFWRVVLAVDDVLQDSPQPVPPHFLLQALLRPLISTA